MTKVVHIYKEHYDVYIGREGHGQDGYFGNSHLIGYCKICKIVHNRKGSIEAYKRDFIQKIAIDPLFKRKIKELKDKTLGCFCAPKECHGHIISNYLDNTNFY